MTDLQKAVEAAEYAIRAATLAGDKNGPSPIVMMKTEDVLLICGLLYKMLKKQEGKQEK